MDRQPSLLRTGKTSLIASRPLHRRPGIVAANLANAVHDRLHGLTLFQGFLGIIDGLNILNLAQICKRIVGHANLLPLIDVGCPPHQVEQDSQSLG